MDSNTTKLCKHCKSEMKKGAKVCPTCGKKQGINTGCLVALIIFGLIIALIVAFVGSCSKAVDDAIKEDDKKAESKSVTAESVIYDKDDIKVTYTGMSADSLNISTEIKLKIENSSDKSVVVSSDDFSVDGYSINAALHTDVAAGKAANDSITVLDSYLKDNGLSGDSIKEAEFILKIFDSNNYKEIDSDTVKISLR